MCSLSSNFRASLVAQMVKNLPKIQETQVQFLGWEDLLEKGIATYSSIHAWIIPMARGTWQATKELHTAEQPHIHFFQPQDLCQGCFSILESLPPTPICIANSVILCAFQDCFSHVQLFATPQTIARQASLSMRFSKQEYWSELTFPTPGDLPNPGIEPRSLMIPCISRQILYHQCHLRSPRPPLAQPKLHFYRNG